MFTRCIMVRLSPKLLQRIQNEAKKQHISRSELVRTAIGDYLALREAKEGPRPSEPPPRRPSILDVPVVNWTPEGRKTGT
jgi:hypothetical protein